jgi:GNAT superfamily N-acetyltransferase
VDLAVSRAVEADAGELWTLQRAAFLTEALEFDFVRTPPLTETLEAVRVAFSEVAFVKVVDGSRIVGCGRLRQRDNGGWVERVCVAPDQQGRGIGSLVVRALEAEAAPTIERFDLYTANLRNHVFYQRLGYDEIGRFMDGQIEIVHFAKEIQIPRDSDR